MHKNLLKSIRSRTGRTGVLTADRYFKSIEACFNGGFCPTKIFNGASPEQWQKALKEAESRLTFASDGLKISQKRIKTGSEVPKGFIMTFDATITTPRRDRDKDVLMTSGANIDPQSALLFGHVPMLPIGSMISFNKSPTALRGRFGLADTDLGNDSAKLIEAKALRLSHGFWPINEDSYEPMDDEEGWLFKEFEIYEVTLTPAPSNVDAVIESYSRGMLKSAAYQAFGKKAFDERPAQGIGFTIKESVGDYSHEVTAPTEDQALALLEKSTITKHADCACHNKNNEPAVVPGITVEKDGSIRIRHEIVESLTRHDVRLILSADGTKASFYKQPDTKDAASPDGLGDMANMAECPKCGYEAPMSAFHKAHSDGLGSTEDNVPAMREPAKSFSDLRKEVVASAFEASLEDVNQLFLQLRGVLDIAEARRESMRWQEISETLGID